ncbi:MAG: ABC transporter substrate-binding protein [Xanthobacteraceae bacterium]|jgi:branched-chain amino acid transport system substrate-binding protein
MKTTPAGLLAAILAAATAIAAPAYAADSVKIGFVGTFSGPAAAIGNDMRDGFSLGIDNLGRQMAGRPVEVIYEDDTQKPDVGKQKTDKLIEADHVDFLTGYGFSNVLLASLLPAVNSKTFIISANAGPSQIAGEQCSPYFFSVSWQGDQAAQATGEYLNQKGIKTLFIIDPNYAAGKDVAAGVKANFRGEVVDEEYTAWPGQLDFSAELTKARAAKPDAVFAFYPGAAGAQFLTQYTQAGLKGQIPLYTAYMIDAVSLPKIGDLAVGVATAGHWAIDLPNAANQKFVADFRAAYKRDPSFYAAQGYDAANFIASAVAAVKGDLADKDRLRAVMEKADYASVRGPYRYGNNHFPIQNFYLQEVVKNADGHFEIKTVATILKDHQDRYHDKCPMK